MVKQYTLLEFYNKLIGLTKATGQGVPLFVVQKAGLVAEMDEMVDKGHLKKINNGSGGFDHALTFYCLTDIYCVEEEEDNGNPQALYFIRRFLGVDQSKDFPFAKHYEGGYDRWLEQAEVDYDQWCEDNKVGLEALLNLTEVTELPGGMSDPVTPSQELVDWVQDKNLYTMTVKEAVDNVKERIYYYEKLDALYDEMPNSKYDEDQKEGERMMVMLDHFLDVVKHESKDKLISEIFVD